MATIETARIELADAHSITAGCEDGMREIYNSDIVFGALNGALDSIMRESPDFDVIYVWRDGSVDIWS